MKKNVCTYEVIVSVLDGNSIQFSDTEGKPYGTLAYQSFMGGGDVQSFIVEDEVPDSNIIILRHAITEFAWTKTCSEETVENDICQ